MITTRGFFGTSWESHRRGSPSSIASYDSTPTTAAEWRILGLGFRAGRKEGDGLRILDWLLGSRGGGWRGRFRARHLRTCACWVLSRSKSSFWTCRQRRWTIGPWRWWRSILTGRRRWSQWCRQRSSWRLCLQFWQHFPKEAKWTER